MKVDAGLIQQFLIAGTSALGRRGHVLLTMKVLNRNQYFLLDCPMRGARAAILCLLAALALRGCMRTAGPVASAQTQSDLDSFAYGQSYAMAPTPAGYAAAPKPVAFDAAYRLDAGDKLRVVVYCKEGLSNTYAYDHHGRTYKQPYGEYTSPARQPYSIYST